MASLFFCFFLAKGLLAVYVCVCVCMTSDGPENEANAVLLVSKTVDTQLMQLAYYYPNLRRR